MAERYKSGPKKGQFKPKSGGKSRKSTPKSSPRRRGGFRGVSVSGVLAAGGAVNAMSSILLGKDIENGFSGDAGGKTYAMVAEGQRLDAIKLLQRTDVTPTGKFGALLKHALWNAQAAVTTVNGAKRTFGPLAVGVAAKTAVKVAKPNRYVPAKLRRVIRF